MLEDMFFEMCLKSKSGNVILVVGDKYYNVYVLIVEENMLLMNLN